MASDIETSTCIVPPSSEQQSRLLEDSIPGETDCSTIAAEPSMSVFGSRPNLLIQEHSSLDFLKPPHLNHHDTLPDRPPPISQIESLHDLGPSLRELRLAFNRVNHKRRAAAIAATKKGASTAWIDQDDSGNYDPTSENAWPSRKGATRGLRRVPNHSENVVGKISGEETDAGENPKKKAGVPKGFREILTIKFTTKPALDYLRSITPGPDLSQSSTNLEPGSDSESDDERSKPRRKTKKPSRFRSDGVRADNLTLSDLTSEHTQYRGCKACFHSSNDDCTLISNQFEYPCESCRDMSVDCELVVPPELKKVCIRCKRKKLPCSYREDGGLNQFSCDQCADDEIACCAPPLDSTSSYAKRFLPSSSPPPKKATGIKSKVFIELGDSEDEDKEPERVYVSCTQCRMRSGELRCSLKDKEDQGPCTNCRKINDKCQFVLPLTASRRRKALLEYEEAELKAQAKSSKKRAREPETLQPRKKRNVRANTPTTHTKVLFSELPVVRRGKHDRPLTMISTCFAHPITFNYIDTSIPDAFTECLFCPTSGPFFPLYGLADASGPLVVSGYYLPHGGGFHEALGGYPKTEPRTKMCVSCTTARIQIFSCDQHIIRTLNTEEIDRRVFDDTEWGRAVNAIHNGDLEGGSLILKARFCTICPNFAVSKCCAKLEGEDEEGCGLLLCGSCGALAEKFMGSGMWRGREVLDSVIAEVVGNKWRFPGGVRADASFLTSGGELIKRLEQGMGLPGDVEQYDDLDEGALDEDELRELKDLELRCGFRGSTPELAQDKGKGKGKMKDLSISSSSSRATLGFPSNQRAPAQAKQNPPSQWNLNHHDRERSYAPRASGGCRGGEGGKERSFGGALAGKTEGSKVGNGEIEVVDLISDDDES